MNLVITGLKANWLMWVWLLAIGSLIIEGCSTWDKPIQPPKGETADQLYKEGVSELGQKNYRQAIETFYKLKYDYPTETAAMMADLKIADAFFANKEYTEAIESYEEFRKMHPASPYIPYVGYMLGLCHYRMMLSVDRDQTNTERAFNEFNYVLTHFANTPYAYDSYNKAQECMTRLSEHEVYVGDFYYRMRKYESASQRYEAAIAKYPSVPLEDKTLFQLADSYHRQDEIPNARKTWSVLIAQYPESKYSEKSMRLLEETPVVPEEQEETPVVPEEQEVSPVVLAEAASQEPTTSMISDDTEAASSKEVMKSQIEPPREDTAFMEMSAPQAPEAESSTELVASVEGSQSEEMEHLVKDTAREITDSNQMDTLISMQAASDEAALENMPGAEYPEQSTPGDIQANSLSEGVLLTKEGADLSDEESIETINFGGTDELLSSKEDVALPNSERDVELPSDEQEAKTLGSESQVALLSGEQDAELLVEEDIQIFGGERDAGVLSSEQNVERSNEDAPDSPTLNEEAPAKGMEPEGFQEKQSDLLNASPESVSPALTDTEDFASNGSGPSAGQSASETVPNEGTEPESNPRLAELTEAEADSNTESAGDPDEEGEKPLGFAQLKADRPINITADRMDAFQRENRVIFEGTVVVRQDDTYIYAQRIMADLAPEHEGGGIRQVVASGEVRITKEDRVAICDKAEFDNISRTIKLSGSPKIWQGSDSIDGDQVIVNLEQEQMTIIGSEEKQVSAVLHPKGEEGAAKAPKAPKSTRPTLTAPFAPVEKEQKPAEGSPHIAQVDSQEASENTSTSPPVVTDEIASHSEPGGLSQDDTAPSPLDEPTRVEDKEQEIGHSSVLLKEEEAAQIARAALEDEQAKPSSSADLDQELSRPESTETELDPILAESVKAFVERWRRAWETKDLDSYMACYATRFKAGRRNWGAWRDYKAALNRRYESIEVVVEDLEVTPGQGGVSVLFVQRYTADQYRDIGFKVLDLVEEDGQWKILRENWKPLPSKTSKNQSYTTPPKGTPKKDKTDLALLPGLMRHFST